MTTVGIKTRQAGLTLIELMVVVAVLTILTTLVYPMYQTQIQKTRREAAREALLETAQQLQRCYTRYLSYTHASCTVTTAYNAPVSGTKKYYAITAPTLSAGAFTLRAVPINTQTGDTNCSWFTVDNFGTRAAENTNCW